VTRQEVADVGTFTQALDDQGEEERLAGSMKGDWTRMFVFEP